jgi:hypothetical protein
MKDGFTSPRRVNSAIPCGVQRIIKKCLRKKKQRRYDSMMDLEKKLGKRLAGRTTKAASLLRISDYLVSRKVFEAAPEQETMIITGKPRASARFRNAVVAGSMLLLLGAGAGAYHYYRTMQEQRAVRPPAALPAAATPHVTRPQTTTTSTETVTAPPLSSAGITTRPAQTAPPPSILQKQTQTTPARKKPVSPRKKKKKTVPVS